MKEVAVVVQGGFNTGKTTVALLIEQALQSAGIRTTMEPGLDPITHEVRVTQAKRVEALRGDLNITIKIIQTPRATQHTEDDQLLEPWKTEPTVWRAFLKREEFETEMDEQAQCMYKRHRWMSDMYVTFRDGYDAGRASKLREL